MTRAWTGPALESPLTEADMRKAHVAAAISFARDRCRRPDGKWREVSPKIGYIYDWADPETNSFGQCWLASDGTWKQAPLGKNPIVLEYYGQRGGRK